MKNCKWARRALEASRRGKWNDEFEWERVAGKLIAGADGTDCRDTEDFAGDTDDTEDVDKLVDTDSESIAVDA